MTLYILEVYDSPSVPSRIVAVYDTFRDAEQAQRLVLHSKPDKATKINRVNLSRRLDVDALKAVI